MSVADQGITSITSFLIVVLAARLLEPVEFGAFSAVFVVYTIIIGAVQAHVGQELVLGRGDRAELVGLSWVAATGTIVASVPLAILLAGSALIFAEARWPLLALALVLPVMMVQEVTRFAMALLRSVHVALLVDCVRLLVVVLVFALPLLLPGTAGLLWSAGGLILIWGLATAVSLLPFSGSLAAAARWGRVHSWRRIFRRDYLGYRFFWEFAAVRASGQGLTIVLGGLAGLAATGALRAASTLFGPVNVLFNAVVAFAVPILREYKGKRHQQAILLLTVALSALALAVTLVLYFLPEDIGRMLLGATWLGAHAVILPIGVQAVGLAISTVMVVAIRMVDPASTLHIRIVGAALTVVLFVVGFFLANVQGAVWGLCAASWIQAIMLVVRSVQLGRGVRDDDTNSI